MKILKAGFTAWSQLDGLTVWTRLAFKAASLVLSLEARDLRCTLLHLAIPKFELLSIFSSMATGLPFPSVTRFKFLLLKTSRSKSLFNVS